MMVSSLFRTTMALISDMRRDCAISAFRILPFRCTFLRDRFAHFVDQCYTLACWLQLAWTIPGTFDALSHPSHPRLESQSATMF